MHTLSHALQSTAATHALRLSNRMASTWESAEALAASLFGTEWVAVKIVLVFEVERVMRIKNAAFGCGLACVAAKKRMW